MSKRTCDTPKERFSRWFKSALETKKLLPAEAARELGVSSAAVSRWGQAKTLPESPSLLRLARWGAISAEELLTMLSEDNL